MRVCEIFRSIDGEGIRTGAPVTFLRLVGCDLSCSYCDTEYAKWGGTEIPEPQLMEALQMTGLTNLTITGGEPLMSLNPAFVGRLTNHFEVNIETNGAHDIRSYLMEGVIITMDYKLPSSGMEDRMLPEMIKCLRKQDVLKFVIGDEADLERAFEVMREHPTEANIFLSPVFGKMDPKKIVDRLIQTDSKARLQLQLHKIIWSPETRGV